MAYFVQECLIFKYRLYSKIWEYWMFYEFR